MKSFSTAGQGRGSPTSPAVDASPSPRPRITSRELFGRAQELVIDHHGQEYRLRLTRNGKLILNK